MKNIIACIVLVLYIPCISAMDLLLHAAINAKNGYGMALMQGRRKTMEDRAECHWEYNDNDRDHEFYAVYDGHGGSGVALIAQYMMRKVCRLDQAETDEQIKDALHTGFLTLHNNLGPRVNTMGSTATVAVIKNAKIFVANAGDSRTVLCRNGVAIPLSNDHKPSRADEWQRIIKAGGYVTLVCGAHRVAGNLAVSRALGDKYLHPYIIPDPEITVTEYDPQHEFLILACDGVWDVLGNQAAVTHVRKKLKEYAGDCQKAAQALIEYAYAQGSTDNISAIIVDLTSLEQ